ncbi:MAG: SOS response-associated peptidase [Aestuariivirga sp.]
MCGLYSFRKSADEARLLLEYLETPEFPPRSYVAPLGPMAIVRTENSERHFALVRWGLIPSWVKEIRPGKPIINVRSETILEKPSFRNAIRRRRCLIPADGFYEWLGDVPGRKIPYFIHRPDHGLFAFAGLWEHWLGADGSELETAAIITTASNEVITQINERMPVVIHPQNFARWLDVTNVGAEEAVQFLKPAPGDYFVFEPTVITRSPPPPKPKAQLTLF